MTKIWMEMISFLIMQTDETRYANLDEHPVYNVDDDNLRMKIMMKMTWKTHHTY